MKEFITVFIACLVFGWAFLFFFGGYLLENIWGTFLLIAFLAAVGITILVKLAIKIEELEKKVDSLLNVKMEE